MASSPRWADVERLYHAALARAPGDRSAFLDEASGGDAALRQEVASLLAQGDAVGSFLSTPALETVSVVVPVSRIGQQLGVYRILSSLGAGGMGEVYRARDTRLSRDVAIKILPPRFAADADRRARFEREARVLASLNHPHIAQIYGFEDAGQVGALVMELVEGQTLEDRIRSGLSLTEVLAFARQIVLSLQAAHAKGVVHRDLKPANIKITPEGVLKVLDFGLAKAAPRDPFDGDVQPMPMNTATRTGEGVVLGTPAYMSPEQARGLSVDTRTDVWAFGCVLFEMLSGKRAFAGDNISETIVSILEREPEWEALPASTPAGVRVVLRRCLEKDATRRLQDIGDAHLEADLLDNRLTVAREVQPETALRRRRPLHLGVGIGAVVIGLAAIGAIAVFLTRPAGPVTVPSEYVQLTDYADAAVGPSLSPDGLRVVYKRGADEFASAGQIYVKTIQGGEALQLTRDRRRKTAQVFTPDGQRVTYTLFFNDPGTVPATVFRTWTMRADGGGEATELLPNAAGLNWIDDRRSLYAEVTGEHFHMPLMTSTVTRTERRMIYSPPDEGMVHFAFASPNRQSVLLVEMDRSHVFTRPCRVVPFDGTSNGREVGPQGTCTSAAWSPDGSWMYVSVSVGGRSHIWRQRFPDGTAEQITFGPSEEEGVAVGPDGRWLVTSVGTRQSAIWIRDADGERAIVSDGYATSPHYSPDGRRVFYLEGKDMVLGAGGWAPASSELKSVELASGNIVSVLPGHLVMDYDLSRDGKAVAFTSRDARRGQQQIWLAPLDRLTPPRLVATNGDQVSFSADGELLFRSLEGHTNALVRIRTDNGSPERLTVPVLDKFGVSPDGAWGIVFSPRAGKDGEAAMVAVPLRGGALRTICAARCSANWSADGKFFYVSVEPQLPGTPQGKTVAMPLAAGTSIPDFARSGLTSNADAMRVPGARMLDQDGLIPGSSPDTYLFQRVDLHRNLFRIPLH